MLVIFWTGTPMLSGLTAAFTSTFTHFTSAIVMPTFSSEMICWA